MGQSYGPRRIFFQIQSIIFFPQIYIWPYPRQNPMWRPQALAWQASPWRHGTMCGAHETFWDWSTHQWRALCETTSVTWRFLQPLLERFSRCPICGANFYRITFSTYRRPPVCVHVLCTAVYNTHVCGCAHMMTCVHSRTKFSVTVCLAITV